MQTITSIASLRGRAIKPLLATVNLGQCATLTPRAAKAAWQRRVTLAPMALVSHLTAYAIPYEWSTSYCAEANDEPAARVNTATPVARLHPALTVNFFTAITQHVLAQRLFKRDGLTRLNRVSQHPVANGGQGAECTLPKLLPIANQVPVNRGTQTTEQAELLKPGLSGQRFLSAQPVSQRVTARLITPTTAATLVRNAETGAGSAHSSTITNRQETFAAHGTQKSMQSEGSYSDQSVQQLLKVLVQHTQHEQNNQRQKHGQQTHQQQNAQQKTLQIIEQQVNQAYQLNDRELQNLKRTLQEIKTIVAQQPKQNVAPRIKPPTFFGTL